ncbi:MAG: hypothetical protein M9964_08240 [Solirubrobacterales bacterium]|nr:hypothetical protein [Thermoleophilales bacterium]MCO5327031.1 hypothetical protein [Solirubrobacterales bacterium]
MKLRPRLTYANVVATLALVLAIGGGTVYAASKLGKNTVTSKAIKKGAVKTSDLAKNAVNGSKVKDGTIEEGDLAAALVSKLQADVTGSASGGPATGLTTNTFNPLPLTGTTTFTPQAGDVSAIAAEAKFSIATTNALNECSPDVAVFVNGEQTRIFISPETGTNSTTLVQSPGRDATGPFGLVDPGTPLTITAQVRGDTDCTPATQLDRLEVRIVQIR